MLDLVLRFATTRNLAAALLLAASLPWVAKGLRYGRWRVDQTRYPAVRDSQKSGEDIARLLESRQARRIEAHYRRVGALIGSARQDGFNVAALQARADSALAYNSPGRRPEAVRILNEVEMAVPRKKVQYIPLYDRADGNMMTDEDDLPAAKPARKGRRR